MVQFRGYFLECADSKKSKNSIERLPKWPLSKMSVVQNDRSSTEITISIISDISVIKQ